MGYMGKSKLRRDIHKRASFSVYFTFLNGSELLSKSGNSCYAGIRAILFLVRTKKKKHFCFIT